jgi:ribonuclease Z
MTKITFLGTASAIPDKDHHNTHILLETEGRVVLIDCGENPIPRFDLLDVDPRLISDLILTHFHPDHVSGVPVFLMDLWLMGKKDSLVVHALDEGVEGVQKMMALFNWDDWDEMFPIKFHKVETVEGFELFSTSDIKFSSSPACHLIPSISIRIDVPGGAICFSSDTSPCESVLRLAENVDVLIHEAAGAFVGHSSAEQAGQIAQQANAKSLYLIHYPPESHADDLINQARKVFQGEVSLTEDLMVVNLI